VYSIEPSEYPRLVIANPKDSEYFDVDKAGQKFQFSNDGILGYVKDAHSGKLVSKSQAGFLGRVFKSVRTLLDKMTDFSEKEPVITIALIIVLLLVSFWVISRMFSSNSYEKVQATEKRD
jgi:hypothetical protein